MNSFSLLSNFMMKIFSSISSSNFIMANLVEKFGLMVLEFILGLVFIVCKFILYFLDIIFFYIKQLSGLNVDTSSLSSLTSGENDMFFNMLTSNPILVTQIIRQLVGLAFVIIIVMAIIAIIKTHMESLKSNVPGNNTKVLKNIFKSVLLIFITPLIAFGGIVMSNILLTSFYNATNLTGSSSLGTYIFSLSSSSGNAFRLYAQGGKRIPIYYEFSEQERYLDQIEKDKLTEQGISYLTSPNNPTYKTHLMIENETYYDFSDLEEHKYYANYEGEDEKGYYDAVRGTNEHQRIRAYAEEYFVMADFIDYATRTSEKFYFKTIEEVLDSVALIPTVYNNLYSMYGIETTSDTIEFSSKLYQYDKQAMEPGGVKDIKYVHVKGALDELYGAVFIVTIEKSIEVAGVNYTYYEPLVNGHRKDNFTAPFESDYIKDGNLIVAKGLFTDDNMPTAIKRAKNGTDVQFYRDSLSAYDLGDVAGIAQMYQESEKNKGFFASLLKVIQAIFNPESLVPKLDVDTEAVKVTYRKESNIITSLQNGELQLNYMFGGLLSSTKSSEYRTNIQNYFLLTKINYLVLIVGSWILLKVCLSVIFALIKRIYELFLLFIIYPASCATMPLDDGSGYKKWFGAFVSKLFMTYGLILGINFVLMLTPIIESMQIFKVSDLTSNTAVRRIATVFSNLVSLNQLTKYLNIFMAVLFQLVAFTLLDKNGVITLISAFFPGEESIENSNAGDEIKNAIKQITSVTAKVTTGVGGIVSFLNPKNMKKKLLKVVPGSALVNEAKDNIYRHKKKMEQKLHMNELKELLDTGVAAGAAYASGDKAKAIEIAMNGALNAQKSYVSSLKGGDGPDSAQAQRKAEADRSKEEKKKEAAENSRDGDGGGMSDESLAGQSDSELEKMAGKAEKFIKGKAKKYKKGKLSDKNHEKYQTLMNDYEKAQAELAKRQSRKDELEQSQARIQELEKKKNGSALSDEETAELEKLQKREAEIHKEEDAQREAYDLYHDKERRKNFEKEQKRRENDIKTFRHRARGKFGRAQKKRLKQIDKSIDRSQEELAQNGLSQYAGMSVAELNKVLGDSQNYSFSYKEREMLKNYRDSVKHKHDMLGVRDNEYKNQADMKLGRQNAKDEKLLRKRGLGSVVKRTVKGKVVNSGLEKAEQQLEKINEDMTLNEDEIDADVYKVRRKAYKNRKKLEKAKARLESKIARAQSWNENNTKDGRKQLRENYKNAKKAQKKKK